MERILDVTPEREKELRDMIYTQYLDTPEWHERRKRVAVRSGHICQLCGAYVTERFQVHHSTYRNRGNELYNELTFLCTDCHGIYHRIVKESKQAKVSRHEKTSMQRWERTDKRRYTPEELGYKTKKQKNKSFNDMMRGKKIRNMSLSQLGEKMSGFTDNQKKAVVTRRELLIEQREKKRLARAKARQEP